MMVMMMMNVFILILTGLGENIWLMCVPWTTESVTMSYPQESKLPFYLTIYIFLICHVLFWNQIETQSYLCYSKVITVNKCFHVEKMPGTYKLFRLMEKGIIWTDFWETKSDKLEEKAQIFSQESK